MEGQKALRQSFLDQDLRWDVCLRLVQGIQRNHMCTLGYRLSFLSSETWSTLWLRSGTETTVSGMCMFTLYRVSGIRGDSGIDCEK